MIKKRMEVCLYGAGNNAKNNIKRIQEVFDVQYFLDYSHEKMGREMYGIKVYRPSIETVNKYPVVITINDVKSAYSSLIEVHCEQLIYAFISYAGGYAYYPCNSSLSIKEVLENTLWYNEKEISLHNIKFNKTKMYYDESQTRVFDIASPIDFNATGGPCACLRNLLLANERFQLIDNFVTLCPSTIYVPQNFPIESHYIFDETDKMRELTFNFDNSVCPTEAVWLQITIWGLIDFLHDIDRYVSFNENDVFLLQDPYIVEAFRFSFPTFHKVFVANHVQGALSSELKQKYPSLICAFDEMQKSHLMTYKNWIFPAKGALEGFLATASDEMRIAAKECMFSIAYNGYEKKQVMHPDTSFIEELNEIYDYDILFASATFLYRNKGVERIPKVLKQFSEITGLRIFWVLVGSGEMESDVKKNIEKYLKPTEYRWYHERFQNQDNIFYLFSKADFYIMMHRVSVFDLSTLQAMAYKCIPMLSNQGGNKELCGYNNGILINPDESDVFKNCDPCIDEWNYERILEMKEKNHDIVQKFFNNKKFIEGYRNVIL